MRGCEEVQQETHKCKCNDNKCRKMKKNCATRGSDAEFWDCKEEQVCVAQPKANGKTRKWGKCRMVGLI